MAIARVSDRSGADAVLAATGRSEDDWFALLDAAGATGLSHREIARMLRDEHAVESWWSQNLTVRYEQARGMRRPGQQADGTFAAGASRRIPGGLSAAHRALIRAGETELGVPPRTVREHPTRPSARWRLEDGSTLLVSADEAVDGRVRAGVMFERLAGEDATGPAKERARRILDALEESTAAE